MIAIRSITINKQWPIILKILFRWCSSLKYLIEALKSEKNFRWILDLPNMPILDWSKATHRSKQVQFGYSVSMPIKMWNCVFQTKAKKVFKPWKCEPHAGLLILYMEKVYSLNFYCLVTEMNINVQSPPHPHINVVKIWMKIDGLKERAQSIKRTLMISSWKY